MSRLWAIVIFLCLLVHFSSADSCEPFTDADATSQKYCGPVFPAGYMVFVPTGASMSDLDSNFTNVAQVPTLFTALPYLSQNCTLATLYYTCAGIFENCTVVNGVSIGLPVCQSDCVYFHTVCASDLAKAAQISEIASQLALLPDCYTGINPTTGQTYPTTNCESLVTYYYGSPQNITIPQATCPPPLVSNPFLANDTSHESCFGACCIPCPVFPYFYPSNWTTYLDTTCTVIAISSFFLALYTVIAYSILPDKRKYPSDIILNLAISMLVCYISIFFMVTPGVGRNRTRCELNGIDLALPGTSNAYAIIQGVLATYGVFVAAMWYGFLVLNIFMSVVFLNTRLGDYQLIYHLVNWGVPLISPIIGLSLHAYGYLGAGTWTILNNGWYMDGILMIPIAIIVFPSVIINTITLTRITTVGLRRNASAKQLIALQIRPLMFVLSILFVFLSYWIHYEIYFRTTPSLDFVPAWIDCLQSTNSTNAQDACSSIATAHLPPYGGYFFSEMMLNSLGFVIVAFFGFKKDVVLGIWYMILNGPNASFFATGSRNSKNKSTSSKGETKMEKTYAAKSSDDLLLEDTPSKTTAAAIEEFVLNKQELN